MDPSRRRRRARRLWTAALAALALPLATLSTLTTSAQAAALQCSVDYKTNDWGSGFTADLTLTNRGTDPISGWTLAYAYAGDQKLSNGWNGSWSQSGKQITVTNASYNGTIAMRRGGQHRGAVHLQRQQRRSREFLRQRHALHRRPPAADHGADQPHRGRGLHPG